MKILITGAKGFVGKNLASALKNIKDGKDKTRPNLGIEEVYEYDLDTEKNCWRNIARKRISCFIWRE